MGRQDSISEPEFGARAEHSDPDFEVCELCQLRETLAATGRCISLPWGWFANVRVSPLRPALVVQTRAHRRGLWSLDPRERTGLGFHLSGLARRMRELDGVTNVYATSFNETKGSHVHFHLVPMMANEDLVGPSAWDSWPAHPIPRVRLELALASWADEAQGYVDG